MLDLIEKYEIDIQFWGDTEPHNRKWRAFQSTRSTPSADGDLYEYYSDTVSAAVSGLVKIIENIASIENA